MTVRPPSVCMLVYGYPPDATGGAERQCRLQALELVRRGTRCLVLTTRRRWTTPRREWDEGCEVVRVPTVEACRERFRQAGSERRAPPANGPAAEGARPPSRFAAVAANAVRWLNAAVFMAAAGAQLVRRRNEIDVIHTHVADWNAGFAGWLGHRLGIPVVAKAAFLPAFAPIAGVPLAGLWTKWRRRIHYFALMDAMAVDLEGQGVPRERIRVVPNGVALPPEAAQPDLHSMVLYVGNLTQGAAHKAFDVLLEAWAQVTTVRPGVRLCIAGAGDPAPWRTMAHKLGCLECIRFVGHVDDLSDLYREAALLVLPSRGEGMSNALLEAMAWGLPAVVSDIPGNRQLVDDGIQGRVVPVGAVGALAQAILDLLADAGMRRHMGAAARTRVRQSCTLEAVVDQLCAAYAGIADAAKARSAPVAVREAG